MNLSSFESMGQRRVFLWMILAAIALTLVAPGTTVLITLGIFALLGLTAMAKEAELEAYCGKQPRFVPKITQWRFAVTASALLCGILIAQTYAQWSAYPQSAWVKLGPATFGLIVYVFFLYKMSAETKKQRPYA